MERKAEILAKQEEKQFTARNDFAFRWLFGTEENKEITRRFLSLVTKVEDIEEIEFETPFLLQDYMEEKTGIVDIKLTLKSGEKINVEMQNYWSPYFPKRSLYYWAKLYAEDFVQGNDYKALSPCIVINLLNDRFPLSDKCHSVYRIMEEQEHRVL
ncbi:MAG: Rpn family recombination-promoting nuclease/putative transposase, partial [Eubacteriales bacterium]|nr:Rpn family recombination-promoting nuclease/putative transposase [Eubacteriales bacterium]